MWRRGRELGKGASGSVYLAIHSQLPDQAMKISPISSMLSRERGLLKKFEDCQSILCSFGSDIIMVNDRSFYNLFLEYASGGSLLDRIIKYERVPDHDIKRYTESILISLDYIHKKGYTHCDIKPEHIFLVEKETPLSGLDGKRKRGCEVTAKIADFGLAKKPGEDIEGVRGTPMYLAPESVLHYNYEPKVDIWALGCVVLQMLMGKTPWDKQAEPEEKLPEIPDWVPEEARDFLERCFVRDPESRWSAEMLLKHPFVSWKVNISTKTAQIEVEIDEYLSIDSIQIKPYFALSNKGKRKIMKMIAEEIELGGKLGGATMRCGEGFNDPSFD